MFSRLSHFTDRLVTLAKRAVSDEPSPAVKKGDGGYANWVIVAIHGLREYLAFRIDGSSMCFTKCTG